MSWNYDRSSQISRPLNVGDFSYRHGTGLSECRNCVPSKDQGQICWPAATAVTSHYFPSLGKSLPGKVVPVYILNTLIICISEENLTQAHCGNKISADLFYFISQLYCPIGSSPMGNSGAFPGESQMWQSRATQPTVHAGCFNVSIIYRTLTWTTGSLTCAQILVHAIDRNFVERRWVLGICIERNKHFNARRLKQEKEEEKESDAVFDDIAKIGTECREALWTIL